MSKSANCSIFRGVKILLIQIGKTSQKFVESGFAEYAKRIGRFAKFEVQTIPDIKGKFDSEERKQREGKLVLAHIKRGDIIYLLDEKGKEYSSRLFAQFVEKNASAARLVFVIGGAHGFSDEVRSKANGQVSLSRMTFSHQLIRLIFAEQLYRAVTIIHGHPYHND